MTGLSPEAREEIAAILEAVARDGMPKPRDLDVALDAIEAAVERMVSARAARVVRSAADRILMSLPTRGMHKDHVAVAHATLIGVAEGFEDVAQGQEAAAPTEIAALKAQHAARVTELLEANNREVERRRAARAEALEEAASVVADAAARLRATLGPRGGNAVDRHVAETLEEKAAAILALKEPKA